ncbi:MAG: protein-export membrane protein SecF [Deltaproteobacteria bacterium RIFCSPLOWO2_12_FULL_40_28]|nr:MAG: protein-export membrane protein SecF [Deltaproteobacteria bacterium RIFCSPHIGHO2_02_FULL_40_28]OGQ18923.1 MAG: protein-export membrane protein SecF [Deltaproteobacteria bacterium RIFCSPHIGHO2_12_FULL_40_32]OGQ39466.1 MAG: protein-export membrane protein SecF [Deltaproteobacteria bacterium RIFCSPLOWO2_02_FULL_40_36]OGQ53356.1 MAG: protein-export membrane protein SecF [Deltaproteobacteria bacterium RIFCSPLOWO2_12_FULL_40_28]
MTHSSSSIFPFMRYRWHFFSVSILFMLASFYMLAFKGFNFGVDFKGGIKLVYQFKENVSENKIREVMEGLSLGEAQIVIYGKKEDNTYLLKVKDQPGRNLPKEISENLSKNTSLSSFTLISEEFVGPKVGAELRRRGFFAIVLTWLLILVYIGFRFDFLFAPGAVIALLHDVMITIGFFIFFGKEFNLPILAALLTITGYSINDTIVIYDRVRENLKKLPSSTPLGDILDQSISETMSRTIVTSLTVLFAVLILYFLGGAVLHDFAFSMIVGIIAGTYSTVFIASPCYLGLCHLFPHQGIRAMKTTKR